MSDQSLPPKHPAKDKFDSLRPTDIKITDARWAQIAAECRQQPNAWQKLLDKANDRAVEVAAVSLSTYGLAGLVLGGPPGAAIGAGAGALGGAVVGYVEGAIEGAVELIVVSPNYKPCVDHELAVDRYLAQFDKTAAEREKYTHTKPPTPPTDQIARPASLPGNIARTTSSPASPDQTKIAAVNKP